MSRWLTLTVAPNTNMDVPEVTQLPELSTGVEDPEAFADMVLTAFLRYDSILLYSEYPWTGQLDMGASWRVHPRDTGITVREFEAGISPSLDSYQRSLIYMRDSYFGTSADRGHVRFRLRQRGSFWLCEAFYSICELSGYWLRLYAHVGATKTVESTGTSTDR